MGVGRILLIGFVGFSVLGAVAAPFHNLEMSTEERLASGERYLKSSCSDVTRNRYINGKLGRGPAYCRCLVNGLKSALHTGDEYRYAAKLHSGIGQERIVFQKERITASVIRVRKQFMPKLGAPRIAQINQAFFPTVRACTRAM